jgi:hypothetical protein
LLAFLCYEVASFAGCPRKIPLRRYASHESDCDDDEVGQTASRNGGLIAGRRGSFFGSLVSLSVVVQNWCCELVGEEAGIGTSRDERAGGRSGTEKGTALSLTY